METGVEKFNRGSADNVISLDSVSKWFGNVVAVSDISFGISGGITGLLGPNGAGKTTLLRLMCGLASPSEGDVRLLGMDPRIEHSVYGRIGIMSEHESAYNFLTGEEYVRLTARLKSVASEEANVNHAIDQVEMGFAKDRRISTYSRGMKQRIRLAAALVGDPEMLLLDEPLNGADPKQRIHFQETLSRLSDEGRSIVISSHILEEVEDVSDNVLLIINGKLAAEGDYRAIRRALDDRPYSVRVGCSDPRLLASRLTGLSAVDSLQFESDGTIIVLSSNVGVLQSSLPQLAQEMGVRLSRVEPMDDSLESVFEYLVGQ